MHREFAAWREWKPQACRQCQNDAALAWFLGKSGSLAHALSEREPRRNLTSLVRTLLWLELLSFCLTLSSWYVFHFWAGIFHSMGTNSGSLTSVAPLMCTPSCGNSSSNTGTYSRPCRLSPATHCLYINNKDVSVWECAFLFSYFLIPNECC